MIMIAFEFVLRLHIGGLGSGHIYRKAEKYRTIAVIENQLDDYCLLKLLMAAR